MFLSKTILLWDMNPILSYNDFKEVGIWCSLETCLKLFLFSFLMSAFKTMPQNQNELKLIKAAKTGNKSSKQKCVTFGLCLITCNLRTLEICFINFDKLGNVLITWLSLFCFNIHLGYSFNFNWYSHPFTIRWGNTSAWQSYNG